ncbi:phasin family protein [Halomonas sp. PAMB 3232]|uniref:phasin family protein n=1 Tax=Halomonas sp. PAMB 3232 TaxID=3075221 RepID=UPI0028A0ABBA|nr:phasin family protein [Halomonas sp. PAMB 3232]WNL37551.1 phasin family protein [Halomonas sp. PAMB 3232]
MATFNHSPINEQFHSLFLGPLQACVSLGVDTSEKLVNAQLSAQKAYVDLGLEQARQLMQVKDSTELREYMEGQQRVAKTLAERVKGDADQMTSIQRDFFQKSQKLTEENVQKAQQLASNLRKTA